MYLTYFPLIFLFLVTFTEGEPSTELLKFMKRYGYLEKEKETSAALLSEDGFSEVLKVVQRFGAINETGKLDKDTIELISSPRCGNPDIIDGHKRKKRFTFGSDGWKKRSLSYYISNRSRQLDGGTVSRLIGKALNTWGAYGDLKFQQKSSADGADIIVSFARGSHGDPFPFDGPGYVLAHAFFPENGDIHFDDDEDWIETTPQNVDLDSGTDFYSVALHELGHSLGLGHSSDPSAVMFPYYKGNDGSIPQLGHDDILGMYELYIGRSRETTSGTITTTRAPIIKEHTQRTMNSMGSKVTKEYPVEVTTKKSFKEQDHRRAKIPDVCEGNYDAVANLRGELYIFKDNYVWRLRDKFRMVEGYPIEIRRMFRDFPKNFGKIDAAYERPDGNMIFFTGEKYWVYDALNFIENSPRNISSDYGVRRIGAVQTSQKDGKTYLYKGENFWRYDEIKKIVDHTGKIQKFRGVPPNLDAAMTWRDGTTYFFKGDKYWMIHKDQDAIADRKPHSFPKDWLEGC